MDLTKVTLGAIREYKAITFYMFVCSVVCVAASDHERARSGHGEEHSAGGGRAREPAEGRHL